MSDALEQEFDDFQPRRSRRARILLFVVLGVIVAFFLITMFASIYTDRLWYSSVGYSGVYDKMLWTRVGLFFGFGLLMGGASPPTWWSPTGLAAVPPTRLPGADRPRPLPRRGRADPDAAAGRGRRRDRAVRRRRRQRQVAHVPAVGQPRAVPHLRPLLPQGRRLLRLHPAVAALRGRLRDRGARAVGALRARRALPVRRHPAAGRDRPDVDDRDRSSSRCWSAWPCWPRRSATTSTASTWSPAPGRWCTGMGYTDQHAVLPARNILVGVALICAVLFFVTAWRRVWLLPGVGISLLVVTSILLGLIWPAFVQHFQVDPTEPDKEAPYIAANIAATRAAYDLDDIRRSSRRRSPATADRAGPDRPDDSRCRCVDPSLISQAFEQIQQVASYYSVDDVLDVDHYPIDGTDRAVVIGARELDQTGINASRPELVQPAHRLHPRQRRHRGVRQPAAGRRRRREPADRVGAGAGPRPGRAGAVDRPVREPRSTSARAAPATPSSARPPGARRRRARPDRRTAPRASTTYDGGRRGRRSAASSTS